jgi:hypothetical protein
MFAHKAAPKNTIPALPTQDRGRITIALSDIYSIVPVGEYLQYSHF